MWFLFCFKIDRVFFFEMPDFLMFYFLKCPIFPYSESDRKNGTFQKVPKMKFFDFWAFKKGKSYHMTKSSFTCFLGHVIIPPV